MSTSHAAMSVIPHGGPAIAIFVGAVFVAVVAAVVAMEMKRKPVPWAATSFAVCLVVLSAGVDVLAH
jgi:protein-S-isoprenylcysteine O-methyltransferase Ste14